MHMQAMQCVQSQCNETDVDQNTLSELSLSDLANIHLAGSSSLAATSVVKGVVEKDTESSLTDGLSLADLASLHASNVERQEEPSIPTCSSNHMSLSELAGIHTSAHVSDTSCSMYEDTAPSVNLPLPQLASLDFTTGFTTPKTGSTLSLSQLASLGSGTSSGGKSSKLTTPKPPLLQDDFSGLVALAAAHLNCSENDNVTSSVDLTTVKPPPGLAPPTVSVTGSSEDTPLASVVEGLGVGDACVSPANASLFATILCMTERDKPKRLVKRHGHLKRKSWRALINPHKKRIPFFTFTTPSPDDYVLQKQKQAFNT